MFLDMVYACDWRSSRRTRVETVLTVLSAHPNHAWTLGLHMERAHRMDRVLQPTRQARAIVTGDSSFDDTVFVESTKSETVASLLRDSSLRRTIVALFTTQSRAIVNDEGVRVQLVGSEHAAETVRPMIGLMVQVIRGMDATQRSE